MPGKLIASASKEQAVALQQFDLAGDESVMGAAQVGRAGPECRVDHAVHPIAICDRGHPGHRIRSSPLVLRRPGRVWGRGSAPAAGFPTVGGCDLVGAVADGMTQPGEDVIESGGGPVPAVLFDAERGRGFPRPAGP